MIHGPDLIKHVCVKGKYIESVRIKPLKIISDERGAIYHMLRNDDKIFQEFGEIYFSKIHPDIVKGWHIHKKMALNYAIVYGKIKLVLYDDRNESKTKGNLMEIFMDKTNYFLVNVPPLVWNGFKCRNDENALIANCATLPHDPEEIERLDPFSNKIPYNWEIKHG